MRPPNISAFWACLFLLLDLGHAVLNLFNHVSSTPSRRPEPNHVSSVPSHRPDPVNLERPIFIPDEIKHMIMSAEEVIKVPVKVVSKARKLFRGDTRHPNHIFRHGFRPKGISLDLSLWLGGSSEGGYVSSTRSFKVATGKNYALGGAREEALAESEGRPPIAEGYTYEIDPKGLRGIWIPNAGRHDDPNFEFAIIGPIPPENVRLAYKVSRKPDGSVKISKIPFMVNPLAISSPTEFDWRVCLQNERHARRGENDCFGVKKEASDRRFGYYQGESSNEKRPGYSTDTETIIDISSDSSADEYFADMANKHSKEKFDNLLREFDHGDLAQRDSLYDQLLLLVPEQQGIAKGAGLARFMGKFENDVLAAIAAAIYGRAVVNVFSTNSSILDEVVTVTSILPFLGCTVGLVKNVQLGPQGLANTALCLAQDTLMIYGFWKILLVAQLAPGFVGWLQSQKQRDRLLDTKSLVEKLRQGQLHNAQRLMQYVQSDQFAVKVANQFSAYQVFILYLASKRMGDLHVVGQVLTSNYVTDALPLVNATSEHIKVEMRRHVCAIFAEGRLKLQRRLEDIVVTHAVTMQNELRQTILQAWLRATWSPSGLGSHAVTLHYPWNLVSDGIKRAKAARLPLFEEALRRTVRQVVAQLKSPSPCLCARADEECRPPLVPPPPPPVVQPPPFVAPTVIELSEKWRKGLELFGPIRRWGWRSGR